MSVVLETAFGVMTKLIELNTTVSTKKVQSFVVHADNQPDALVLRRASWSCSDLGVEIWPALSTFVRSSLRCHFLHFSPVADTCDALTLSSIPCRTGKKKSGLLIPSKVTMEMNQVLIDQGNLINK